MNWKVGLGIGLGCLLAGLAVVLFFVLTGGETTQAVLDRYAPRFADKRQQLKALAGKLPPLGGVQANLVWANLEPKPVYDTKNKTFNTSVIMIEHMGDPDVRLRTPGQFDLNLFEGLLLMHLQWTGPKNPMAESARKQRARSELARELEATLNQPYLVVLRPVSYDPPLLQPNNKFLGGEVALEGFLFDWRSMALVGSVKVSGKAADVVRGRKGEMDAAVFSSLWVDVRTDLARALSQASGGRFAF